METSHFLITMVLSQKITFSTESKLFLGENQLNIFFIFIFFIFLSCEIV